MWTVPSNDNTQSVGKYAFSLKIACVSFCLGSAFAHQTVFVHSSFDNFFTSINVFCGDLKLDAIYIDSK